MNSLSTILVAITLCLSYLPGDCAAGSSQRQRQEQSSEAVLHIAEIIDQVAESFNYRSVRAYEVEPDEWATAERQQILITHAYYSLFSRDPDSLLDLGPMHRGVSSRQISAIILLFKDADLARKEMLRLSKTLEGDLGAEVVNTGENGFEIKGVWRNQIAVRHGAKVILLKTDKQRETMAAMTAKIKQASW
jgi:hypothetical protein